MCPTHAAHELPGMTCDDQHSMLDLFACYWCGFSQPTENWTLKISQFHSTTCVQTPLFCMVLIANLKIWIELLDFIQTIFSSCNYILFTIKCDLFKTHQVKYRVIHKFLLLKLLIHHIKSSHYIFSSSWRVRAHFFMFWSFVTGSTPRTANFTISTFYWTKNKT